VPERVVVDTATLGSLPDRLTDTAAELATVSIRGLQELTGSALSDLAAPARAAAEVQRLGAALQDWVCSLRRSLDELGTADDNAVDRFRHR